MKKHSAKVIVFALVCVLLTGVLTSCSPYRQKAVKGGDAKAAVYGNGGLVVTQGKYQYFINGKMDSGSDNTFKRNGKYKDEEGVVKGGVMRQEIDANGNPVGSPKTIVPQALYNTYTGTGLYIFGEWIYYVTPNTAKDKSGSVLSGQTLIMRTKIDGTGTQKIATVKNPGSSGLKYKVTKDYIVYIEGSELKSVDLSKKNFKTSVIDDEVSDIIVPKVPAEVAASSNGIFDYVFYVKASDEKYTGLSHNEVKATNGNGSKVVISGTAYAEAAENAMPDKDKWMALAAKERVYSYTLTGAYYEKIEGAYELALYANRTQYKTNRQENAEGVFGFGLGTGLVFNRDKVRIFTKSASTSYYPLGLYTGILNNDGGVLNFYEGMAESAVEDGLKQELIIDNVLPKAVKVFGGSSVTISYVKAIAVDTDNHEYNYSLYFVSGGALKKATLRWDKASNDYDPDDFRPSEVSQVIIKSDVSVDWLPASIIKVGNVEYFYFIYSENYNYLHRISLTKADAQASVFPSEDNVPVRFGAFTKADRESYEKREEEREEAKNNK